MGKPHADYRENSARCIYLTGHINQELVNRLSPTINKYRLSSTEPITVYIDSLGGSIALANVIQNLIKSPNPDGRRCRMIVAVTGTAASAAADFLALGDYTIAYPHSSILYHGSRESREDAITSEIATRIANSLQQTNEFFAVRLARRAFERFVFRLSQLNEEFQAYINVPTIQTLITSFRGNDRFSSQNSRLLRSAVAKQHTIQQLTVSVAKHITKFKKRLSEAEFEVEIFKGILNHKLKAHKKEDWVLSGAGLQEASNDFALLHDFHFGSQKKDLARLEKIFGTLFLTSAQKSEYDALIVSEELKTQWLCKVAEPKLQPLWYFMVSLCRLLQEADYSLSPTEAYWMGLVDEVPGSGLPNEREIMENIQTQDPASPALSVATSATAQPQPSGQTPSSSGKIETPP